MADLFANQPVVIDNGSGFIRAGFAGKDDPSFTFPSYVGRPKHVRVMAAAAEGDTFVGERAQSLRGLLSLRYPIQRGVVKNWDDLETLWQHSFSLLSAPSDAHPVLLTEPTLTPTNNKLKQYELLFERFSSPCVFIEKQEILSLYSSGRTTGCVVCSGEGTTNIVPVVEGFLINNAISRLDMGGRDVTDYLALLLRKAGYPFHTTAEMEIIRDLKEAMCYVAVDIEKEEKAHQLQQRSLLSSSSQSSSSSATSTAAAAAASSSSSASSVASPSASSSSSSSSLLHPSKEEYKLPDGSILSLSTELYRAPEILFQPHLVGLEQSSITNLIIESINKVDCDLRKNLFVNIVLAGGNTLFDGFGDRLINEMKRSLQQQTKIKVYAPFERSISAWIGGSILASLATFKKMYVTKKEYEEMGEFAVLRKTFH